MSLLAKVDGDPLKKEVDTSVCLYVSFLRLTSVVYRYRLLSHSSVESSKRRDRTPISISHLHAKKNPFLLPQNSFPDRCACFGVLLPGDNHPSKPSFRLFRTFFPLLHSFLSPLHTHLCPSLKLFFPLFNIIIPRL